MVDEDDNKEDLGDSDHADVNDEHVDEEPVDEVTLDDEHVADVIVEELDKNVLKSMVIEVDRSIVVSSDDPLNDFVTWFKQAVPSLPLSYGLLSVLMIACCDYFVYQGSAGLGQAILLLLMMVLVLVLFRPKLSGVRVIAPALTVLLLLRMFWQSEPWTLCLAFFILFAIVYQHMAAAFRLPEFVCSGVVSVYNGVRMLLGAGRGFYAEVVKLFRIKYWVAIIIPVFIVCIFLVIFSLANPVVAGWLADIKRFLISITDYFPTFLHMLFWFIAGLLSMALLCPVNYVTNEWNALFGDTEELTVQTPGERTDLWALTALNTLVAVNILFFAYNCIDFVYLWIENSLPEGVMYSNYARSGTLWLTIALALTSVILGCIFSSTLNFNNKTFFLKILSWLWIAQNIILAFGTYQRLSLYVGYNGLTPVRIVGVYGITLVLLGLLIVFVKIRKQRSTLWMFRRQMLAFVIALFLLGITPIDFIVSHYNSSIILSGNSRPAVQLSWQRISSASIPGLIPLLESEDKIIRAGVAAILLREQIRLLNEQRSQSRWTYFEWSTHVALAKIKAHEDRIKQLVPTTDYNIQIEELESYTRRWY